MAAGGKRPCGTTIASDIVPAATILPDRGDSLVPNLLTLFSECIGSKAVKLGATIHDKMRT
jgi:hypothetical protein